APTLPRGSAPTPRARGLQPPATRSVTPRPTARSGAVDRPRRSDRADQGVELLARDRASAAAHLAAVTEHDERRDGADVEAARRRRVAVGVELHDQHVALALAGEIVQDRCHYLAWAARVGIAVLA